MAIPHGEHPEYGDPQHDSPGNAPVRAIVRIRLAPHTECDTFECWLRATPEMLSAALVTGAADYELQLDCAGFADLGDALTRICGWPGVAVESVALVLHEVTGLGQQEPAIPDEVTMRRMRKL